MGDDRDCTSLKLRRLANAVTLEMGRHARDFVSVDADPGKGPARTGAAHKPLGQVPLYAIARGLTTSPMPYGGRSFQIDLDFIHHQLRIETSRGERDQFALRPCSVAEFYSEVMGRLRALGLEVRIWTMPVELGSCSAVRGGSCACLL